jgi:hypothetical protein
MTMHLSACYLCGATKVVHESVCLEFSEGDITVSSTISDEEHEQKQRGDDQCETDDAPARKHLCEACLPTAVAKYRPRDGKVEGTLAEVLQANYWHQRGMIMGSADEADPDIAPAREQFPGVTSHCLAREYWRPSLRALADVLRGVGKPVGYFDPALEEANEFPYRLYKLDEDDEPVTREAGIVDFLCLGAVSAYEYAPDGTILDDQTEK